jgi:hypothetical protein
MHENLLGSVMTAHSLASAVVEVAMKTPLLARSVGDEQGLQEWLSRVVRSHVYGTATRKNSAARVSFRPTIWKSDHSCFGVSGSIGVASISADAAGAGM